MFNFDFYTWVSAILTVFAVSVIAIRRYLARNDDYWKKRGVTYYPRTSILTILKQAQEKPLHEIQKDINARYGKVFGVFEFSTPSLSVSDPDLLRDILVKDFQVFHYRRDNISIDSITDRTLSVLKGEDWKRVRTIITPAFTSKRMRQMSSIINECSKSVVESCEDHFSKGEAIDCKGTFGAFSMDVIASAAFATKINSHNDPTNIFVKKVKETFLEPSIFRVLLFFVFPFRLLRLIGLGNLGSLHFFKDITIQVIKERKQSGKKYNDILQILMDAAEENSEVKNSELVEDEEDRFGSITDAKTVLPDKHKHLSEDELLAQCVLFFLVGYETTASTLTFMAYSLASNPEWQEKLIVEVDEAFKKHKEMSYDAVRDMKVLDGVLSETLRMYPVAIGTERTADADYTLGNTGIIIEKGKRVAVPIYAMHYDPAYFEEPEKFNPNRFIDSDSLKHPQYAFLPFGAGPRNCLGMRFALLEIKLCMTNILRHFRFRIHKTTKVPLEYKKLSGFLSVNNLPLSLEKRT